MTHSTDLTAGVLAVIELVSRADPPVTRAQAERWDATHFGLLSQLAGVPPLAHGDRERIRFALVASDVLRNELARKLTSAVTS
jgi:hypothetical protein